MKRVILVVIGVLAAPIFAHGAKVPEQKIEVDQQAYERVFLGCLNNFKNVDTKDEDVATDIIRACDDSAQRIAIRKGTYRANDWSIVTPLNSEETK
ncbi:hypothetical protein ASESINO_134 [Erwinia phage vB_EamM_Asesino]|uniref:Uncharacterized protein n=1 Tax=Erwinia phage vB_EamM_Asesino TaxID=1883370 RepID=A0A1B2IA49_9CAUD|nr:hypothetical protein ASESINO_134 [Erwinia phage vB_EamM_Asesino]ANZ48147.1 hypothetical protein ASESINO_134 [Erwinia phage vB_EamM_Asesino]